MRGPCWTPITLPRGSLLHADPQPSGRSRGGLTTKIHVVVDAQGLPISDALMMAIWRRGKPDALLHHSDQGSQYTSEKFQRLMADNGVTCSMSRSGNVWDNAAMESFFSSMKTERVGRKTYRTRNHANADVFDYIERFYNPTRRHSTLGYLSPMDFERQAQVA